MAAEDEEMMLNEDADEAGAHAAGAGAGAQGAQQKAGFERKKSVSIRAYLDHAVVPALLVAMAALAKARPENEDPVIWLANYLIKHQAEQTSSGAAATLSSSTTTTTTTTTTTSAAAASGSSSTPAHATQSQAGAFSESASAAGGANE